MLAMSFFILKEKIFVSLAFVTFTFTLQHLSYKITSSIVYAADPDLATSGYYFLIYVPIFLLVDGLFFTFAYLKKKKGFSFQVNSYLALALSLVMVISNIVVSYYSQEQLLEASNHLFSLVSLLSIFLCLATIYILFSNSANLSLSADNETLEMLLEKDKEKYEFAKLTAENINIHYHDLKQQIREHGIDKEEVAEIKQAGSKQESLYYTGNKSLDILLFEKNLICQKQGIQLLFLGDGNLLEFMHSNHIYSLFGNLIDNAIEGLKDVEDDRKIRVEIKKVKNSILILTENKTSHDLKKDAEGRIQTTKKEANHGYGIKSIINIANRYDGQTLFTLNDGLFIAKVVFPISDMQEK